MSQLSHKQFVTQTEFRDALLRTNEPLLRAALYPRRIVPPPNYLNPQQYGVCAASVYPLWMRPDFRGLAHTTGMLMALLLAKYLMPTYFVEPEFIEAVAQTDPPEDFYLKDIKWPLPAMLFVLPDAFVQKYFGYYVPFIAIAKAEAGVYPQKAAPYPKTEHDLRYASSLRNENDRIIFHTPMFLTGSTPTDYTGNFPLDAPLSVIETGKFDNSIPFDEAAYSLPRQSLSYSNEMTEEQDRSLTLKVNSLAVKLMLAITARPEYIENHNRLAREPKVGKKAREALYHPNMLGTKFRVLRPRTSSNAGTGKAMPMHWHPGFWSHVAKGPRADFLPITALPLTAEGRVDWTNTPKEMLQRFWACHELTWILPYLVNAPSDEKSTQAA